MANLTIVSLNGADSSNYDNNGAIIYTAVTLIFYSLSLFCSLILNIDPTDHYEGNKVNIYFEKRREKSLYRKQADVLDTLMDESLRKKYWQIYYGNDEYERRSSKLLHDENKRLLIASQVKRKITNEEQKYLTKDNQFEIVDSRIRLRAEHHAVLNASLFEKFRRPRSVSISNHGISHRTIIDEIDSISQISS